MIAYGVPSPLRLGDGSATLPTYGFASAPTMGMYRYGATQIGFSTNGSAVGVLDSSAGWYLLNNAALLAMGGSSDVVLHRDGAGMFGQRNGANGQTFRVYNTYTDSGNYERGGFIWSANVLNLLTEQAGTGTARTLRVGTSGAAALQFRTNGVDNWQIDSSGNLIATDNTFDIGASGATRPRTGYFGTAIATGTTPATGGAVRFANATYAFSRNQANSANVPMIGVNSGNEVVLGYDGSTAATAIVFGTSATNLGFFGAVAVGRQTYGAPTGTATRTTFATGTVTTAQLAERVKAMIDDLRSFGLFA